MWFPAGQPGSVSLTLLSSLPDPLSVERKHKNRKLKMKTNSNVLGDAKSCNHCTLSLQVWPNSPIFGFNSDLIFFNGNIF